MYVPSKSSKRKPPSPKILKRTGQPRKVGIKRKPAIKKIGASIFGLSYWNPGSNFSLRPPAKIQRRAGAATKRQVRATKSKGT